VKSLLEAAIGGYQINSQPFVDSQQLLDGYPKSCATHCNKTFNINNLILLSAFAKQANQRPTLTPTNYNWLHSDENEDFLRQPGRQQTKQ
jgi:hypothetical protein